MAQLETSLTMLILFAIFAVKVDACVCYVGQGPDQATGKQYGWSLPEQRLCECTEFRLGGVNVKPQIKPYKITIGEDPQQITIGIEGDITPTADSSTDQYLESTPFGGSSPCKNNNTYSFKNMDLQRKMTSPILLEFKVHGGTRASVFFYHGRPHGIFDAVYKIVLGRNYAAIVGSELPAWSPMTENNGISYIGVPVIITYDNGHFELAVKGMTESTQTYDVRYTPPTSFFVSFEINKKVKWSFVEPCISDFNAQFNWEEGFSHPFSG